jgi:hypothetical protein
MRAYAGLRRAVKPSFITRCALSEVANRSYDFGGASSSPVRKKNPYSQQRVSDANGVRAPAARRCPPPDAAAASDPSEPEGEVEIGSPALAT